MENGVYRKSSRTWLVLLGCCLLQIVVFQIPNMIFSIFMLPISTDLAVPTASIASYYSLLSLGTIPTIAFAGKIINRFGAKWTVTLSGLICGLAFAAISLAAEPFLIWVLAFIVGLTVPLCSYVMIPIVLDKWFYTRSGLMISIAIACSGIGGIIISPIASALIVDIGWRTTIVYLAALISIVSVLVGFFIIRNNPLELGILPHGASQEEARQLAERNAGDVNDAGVEDVVPGMVLKDALKHPAFWICAVMFILFGFVTRYQTNINTIFQSVGFAAATAALAVSVCTASNFVGKILVGAIKDRFGALAVLVFASGVCVVGFGLFLIGIPQASLPILMAGVVISCLGSPMNAILPALVVSGTFGRKDYDNIFSALATFSSIGSVVAAPSLSAMFDATGSYMVTMGVEFGIAIAIIPLGIIAVKSGLKTWNNRA